MSRKKYDANLPRNLTYRKASKSFFWRNPVTDKEFPLGQIARRDAITQTIECSGSQKARMRSKKDATPCCVAF